MLNLRPFCTVPVVVDRVRGSDAFDRRRDGGTVTRLWMARPGAAAGVAGDARDEVG